MEINRYTVKTEITEHEVRNLYPAPAPAPELSLGPVSIGSRQPGLDGSKQKRFRIDALRRARHRAERVGRKRRPVVLYATKWRFR